MNKFICLFALSVLIIGCISNTPYETYNKDKSLATMPQDQREYFIAIKKKIYDLAYQKYILFENGRIYLHFTVLKDGTMENLQTDRNNNTGSDRLVNIALKAAKDAAPFPTFPSSLSQYPKIDLNIVLDFNIVNKHKK